MTTRTAQTLTVTVGTATVEVTVDYGIDSVLITRYDTITTDRGVVYEASHELVAASNVAPARWVSGGVVSSLATADENFRDLSAASREAEARASSQWRVFRRRIAAAVAATQTAEADALASEIATLQGARIDAANDLADADARCRNANHPETDATDEERREAYEARAVAQTRYDDAAAELSAALTAQRSAYEDACRGE